MCNMHNFIQQAREIRTVRSIVKYILYSIFYIVCRTRKTNGGRGGFSCRWHGSDRIRYLACNANIKGLLLFLVCPGALNTLYIDVGF